MSNKVKGLLLMSPMALGTGVLCLMWPGFGEGVLLALGGVVALACFGHGMSVYLKDRPPS